MLMDTMKRHHISFRHAWDGIRIGFSTQPNFRVHLSLSILAIVMGIILRISSVEWVVIVFTIATGLAVEMINTAIEYTVDLLTTEFHLLAKYAKDTAAAAMLLYAVGSTIIALIIFLPKIWRFI